MAATGHDSMATSQGIVRHGATSGYFRNIFHLDVSRAGSAVAYNVGAEQHPFFSATP